MLRGMEISSLVFSKMLENGRAAGKPRSRIK